MFASALWETASQPLTSCCGNEIDAGLAAGAVPPSPAGSAGAIGQVVGTVVIVRSTGALAAAAPGMPLFDGDFLQAAGSSVVVVLADGRRIAVQERGQLIVHAPGAGDSIVVEAAGGRFVVLGGSALDGLPDLLVITPAARIHPGSAAIAFHHAAADGLRVMLAEDETAEGVLVENGFGRVVIRDGDEVASVGGSDQPPVLEHDPSLAVAEAGLPPEATAGLTLAEGLDVSPGGDTAAFPGDPVVSHAEAGLFDLAPQTLALPDPVFGGVSARDTSWAAAPRTLTELLLQGSPQQSQAVAVAPAGRQLRGWEPLGLTWDILGDAEVTPGGLDVGPRRLGRLITPTEAGSMARLASATDGVGPIDDFFGLAPDAIRGSLTGVVAAGTSAIRSTQLRLAAGSTLSFDWFFDAANQSPRHDTALFIVGGKIFKLADSADIGAHGASGWRTFVWHVDKTGVYTLGFASVNDHTVDDASRLYVDNVRRNRSFGDDYGLADKGDGWEVLVQKPTLRDDTLSVGEDGVGTTNALANDTDRDPFDPMVLTGVDRQGTVGLPGYTPEGVVSFDARGRFDYLAVGETATTSFRYEADAGNGALASAVVRVTIVGANDAPVARADAPVAVAADASPAFLNVLANDDDVDSDDDRTTLRVVAAEAASGAPVDITGRPREGIVYHPDGRFVALAAGETATDVITYTIEDQHGARATAEARVTIIGSNDLPVAAADHAEGSEDAAVAIAVLANDRDPDTSDRLHVVAVDGRALTAGSSVALASGAVVTLTPDGMLTYDPAAGFNGLADGESAADTFRYQISDGHGGFAEATATVHIEGRNDAPVAAADAGALNAGAALNIAVLANDDDPDSDDGPASLRIVAAQTASGADVSFTGQPGEGLIYGSAVRFRALGAGETATDTLTYTVEDRHGARSSATVTVTVNGVDDVPTATADDAVATEDSGVAIVALANDTDPDTHDRLAVVAIDGKAIAPGGQVVLASGAIVALDAAGALSWSPASRFEGLSEGETAADHFRYRIADGHGGFAEAEVTVQIQGRNDAPIALPDTAAAGEDTGTATVIDVLANDDDVDSDDDGSTLRVVGASAASGASVEIAADSRQLHYTAHGAWERLGAGETAIDTISYTIADRHGAQSTATVAVTVTGVNDAPTAVADTLMIDANTVLRLPGPAVLANDRDPDSHDTRTIIAIDGAAANVGRTITLASGALLSVAADGHLTYDPNGRFTGLAVFERATDSFSYTIADGSGATSTATVTVQIQGVNDAPTAAADTAITDADAAVRIPVLNNDTDPDAGNNLRVLEVDSTGSLGSVRINADGTLTWNPGSAFDYLADGQQATDTFRYVLDDFVGGRSTGVVTVTVVGRADAAVPPLGEIVQSFEVPSPLGATNYIGSVVETGSAPTAVASLFRPTHQTAMAVLTAEGKSALDIERLLSLDLEFGGRPLLHLPDDHASPVNGSAMRTTLSLSAADVVDGRTSLSFDWNFVSGEVGAGITPHDDYAVFTVTDGTSVRVFTLADARSTAGTSDGWRTSVFDVGSAFTLPGSGSLSLTVGFAVINDASPERPSWLLVDNLRLNRPLGSSYEALHSAADGSLTTFRERPTAGDDAFNSAGAVPLSEDREAALAPVGLLANDHTSAGAAASSLRLTGLDTTGTLAAVSLAGGSILWDPRGRLDFLAEGETDTDSFGYLVSDANGGTGAGRVTMTVTGVNDAPVAAADSAAAAEDGASVTIDVLANDDDVDSDDDRSSLRVISASAASGAMVTAAGIAGAGLVYDPRSVAAFQALAEGQTMVDQVTYTIADRHGAQASGTVLVTISGRNDAPVAAADVAAGNEDAPLTIAVLANDRDPDLADRLAVIAIDGHAVAPGGQVTLVSGAAVSLAGDGSLQWDPRDAFASLSSRQTGVDAFTYTVGDGHGGASTARIEVSVAGRNDAPSVGADGITATAGTRLTIAASTLLANDHDVDAGDSLHLVSVDGSGATGTVSLDGGVITWDAADHYRGLGEGETATDTFVYRVADTDGAVTSGTVSVTVHGVNDAPIAVNDAGVTDEDTAVTLRVLGNDTDPDVHDQLSLLSVDTTGTQGQVTINGDGSITYDPSSRFDALNAGDTAYDAFRYRVSDGHGGSSEATATITVNGRSDTERLVDSFETAFSASNRTGAAVTVADQHVETDGAHGLYKPTDGSKFARLEATGATAAQTETFLGQPAGALPKDSDGTFPAQGSAARLTVAVQAGDAVSFDWMFDARDFVTHPADGKADNDFAVLSVTGDGTPQLYLLSDVRHTGDQGASGWRTSVFTASHSGSLTIGFACMNDRITGSPVAENSVLLVDNLRLNRAFGPGYQVVDTQGDGHFETLMHT